MRAELHIIKGHDKGRTFPLDESTVLIVGRSQDNDVSLLDLQASRRHCKFFQDESGLLVADMNSLNGTYVQGEMVARRRLVHGDRISVGNTEMEIIVDGQPRRYRGSVILFPFVAFWRAWNSRFVRFLMPGLAFLCVLLAGISIAHRWFSPSPRLQVKTSPSPAEVFIDGAFAGISPLTPLALAQGPHLVKVARHGYAPVIRKIDARNEDVSLAIALEPLPAAKVSIASKPDGAEVFLDGEFRGKTPLTIHDLPLGEHSLRLSKPDYLEARETLKLAGPELVNRNIELKLLMVQFYEDQIKREPDSAKNYSDLAHLLILNRKFDEAIEKLTAALELVNQQRDTSAYVQRLRQEIMKAYRNDHYEYGDFRDLAKFRSLIEEMLLGIVKKYPMVYQNYQMLIQFYQQSGRLDEAIKLYGAAHKYLPYSWEVTRNYGMTLLSARRFKEARQMFDAAIRAGSRNWEAHYLAGMAKLKGARTDADRRAARQNFENALKYCSRRSDRKKVERALAEIR